MSHVPSTQRSKRIHASCRSDIRVANSGKHPFFVGLTAILLFLPATSSHAVTRYVEKWGSFGQCTKSAPCSSIQNAINQSGMNDRIVVGPGRYTASLVIYATMTGLKLESTAGRHATVIDAVGGNYAMEIRAAKVKVGKKGKGFTFVGAINTANSYVNAGIRIDVDGEFPGIRIEGNRFGYPRRLAGGSFDNEVGLYVLNGGGKIQVRNNIFENNQSEGVLCRECTRALFRENRMQANGNDGMEISNSQAVSTNRNMATTNLGYGFYFDDVSEQVKHLDNVGERNDIEGILVFEDAGSRVEANIAMGNTFGISVYVGDSLEGGARIRRNLAVNNTGWGIRVATDPGARVESNTVVDNGFDGIHLQNLLALGSLKNNSAYGNTQCGIEADSGTFSNYKFFSVANGTDEPCGAGNISLTGPTPSKPGALNVRTAAKIVGG